MTGILWLAVLLTGMPRAECGHCPEEIGSFLDQPAYCEDHCRRYPVTPYCPQPGDIIFSADRSRFWTIMHKCAGTSHPTHSMIAFRRRDGSMAILEAGPHDTLHIETMDAIPHLRSYEVEGRVWVRRRAVPLTCEESDRLTEFCEIQDHKRFALIRLGQQLTPLRARGPIKTYFCGKPHGAGRRCYYCAELVIEAIVYAGLLDPEIARPSATYPRDFFMDASLNIYNNRHLCLAPCWDMPARWTSGCEEKCGK
jgi:hypothetical protein